MRKIVKLAGRRAVSMEFLAKLDLFCNHGPLDKLVNEGFIERGT